MCNYKNKTGTAVSSVSTAAGAHGGNSPNSLLIFTTNSITNYHLLVNKLRNFLKHSDEKQIMKLRVKYSVFVYYYYYYYYYYYLLIIIIIVIVIIIIVIVIVIVIVVIIIAERNGKLQHLFDP